MKSMEAVDAEEVASNQNGLHGGCYWPWWLGLWWSVWGVVVLVRCWVGCIVLERATRPRSYSDSCAVAQWPELNSGESWEWSLLAGQDQPTKPNTRWAEWAEGPAGQGQVAPVGPGSELCDRVWVRHCCEGWWTRKYICEHFSAWAGWSSRGSHGRNNFSQVTAPAPCHTALLSTWWTRTSRHYYKTAPPHNRLECISGHCTKPQCICIGEHMFPDKTWCRSYTFKMWLCSLMWNVLCPARNKCILICSLPGANYRETLQVFVQIKQNLMYYFTTLYHV